MSVTCRSPPKQLLIHRPRWQISVLGEALELGTKVMKQILFCNPCEVGQLRLGQSAARFQGPDAIVTPSVSEAACIGDSAAASAASLCGVFRHR